ncbi:MAG: hypothetical protein AAGI69_22980 [Cyanobacteria bacterium P01_H01_bin.21]
MPVTAQQNKVCGSSRHGDDLDTVEQVSLNYIHRLMNSFAY